MSWEAIFTLVGVVIGAGISGGLQVFNQRSAFQFERQKVKDERALMKLEHLMEHVESLKVQFSDGYQAIMHRFKGWSDTMPSLNIKMDKVSSHISLYANELTPTLLRLLKLYSEKWIPAWSKLIDAIGEGNKDDALERELRDAFREVYEVLVEINIEIPKIAREKDLV